MAGCASVAALIFFRGRLEQLIPLSIAPLLSALWLCLLSYVAFSNTVLPYFGPAILIPTPFNIETFRHSWCTKWARTEDWQTVSCQALSGTSEATCSKYPSHLQKKQIVCIESQIPRWCASWWNGEEFVPPRTLAPYSATYNLLPQEPQRPPGNCEPLAK